MFHVSSKPSLSFPILSCPFNPPLSFIVRSNHNLFFFTFLFFQSTLVLLFYICSNPHFSGFILIFLYFPFQTFKQTFHSYTYPFLSVQFQIQILCYLNLTYPWLSIWILSIFIIAGPFLFRSNPLLFFPVLFHPFLSVPILPFPFLSGQSPPTLSCQSPYCTVPFYIRSNPHLFFLVRSFLHSFPIRSNPLLSFTIRSYPNLSFLSVHIFTFHILSVPVLLYHIRSWTLFYPFNPLSSLLPKPLLYLPFLFVEIYL